jgi:hypothetical protein
MKDALKKIEEAIDKMTDEELIELVKNSGVTKEIADQYAVIEKIIIDEKFKLPHTN